MHGPDDAARGVENNVQIDEAQCSAFVNHAKQNKDVGDQHGCEELKKIFDPKMHNPETPEVCGREMLSGMRQQADSVKGWNGKSREQKEPGHVSRVLHREPPAKATIDNCDPEEQADR